MTNRPPTGAALEEILRLRPLMPLEPGDGPSPRVAVALRADLGRMQLTIHGHDLGDGAPTEKLARLCGGSAAQPHVLSDVANQSLFAELTVQVPEQTGAWPLRWGDVPVHAILSHDAATRLCYTVSASDVGPGWARLAASFNAPVRAVINLHEELGYLSCDAERSWARWSAVVHVGPPAEGGTCPRRVETVEFMGHLQPQPGAAWSAEPPDPAVLPAQTRTR